MLQGTYAATGVTSGAAGRGFAGAMNRGPDCRSSVRTCSQLRLGLGMEADLRSHMSKQQLDMALPSPRPACRPHTTAHSQGLSPWVTGQALCSTTGSDWADRVQSFNKYHKHQISTIPGRRPTAKYTRDTRKPNQPSSRKHSNLPEEMRHSPQ